MESHCPGHQRGIDSWTVIISGKQEKVKVFEKGNLYGMFHLNCPWFSINVQSEKFGN